MRLKLGSPVLFRQQRLGLHGEPFTLYKFRTMADARDTERAAAAQVRVWFKETFLDALPT